MKIFTLTFYVSAPEGMTKTEVITTEPASAALDMLRGMDLLEGVFQVDDWENQLQTLPGPSMFSVPFTGGKMVVVGSVRSKAQLQLDAIDTN